MAVMREHMGMPVSVLGGLEARFGHFKLTSTSLSRNRNKKESTFYITIYARKISEKSLIFEGTCVL